MMRFNLILLFVSYFFTNCMIGTQKQSCMYYVERDYGNACLNLAIGLKFGEEDAPLRSIGINYSLVNCYTYLKKKRECDQEENHYLPGLYGANDMDFEIYDLARDGNTNFEQKFFIETLNLNNGKNV